MTFGKKIRQGSRVEKKLWQETTRLKEMTINMS